MRQLLLKRSLAKATKETESDNILSTDTEIIEEKYYYHIIAIRKINKFLKCYVHITYLNYINAY